MDDKLSNMEQNEVKCTSASDDKKPPPFIPREYQVEILEKAKKGNTIACLGTGTGKTFIAVLLIKENAHHVQTPFKEGGKRIFFLVPTVPLVVQQANVIKAQTELEVGRYYGEMNIDMWDCDKWAEEFVKYQVLVMTGEICRIILHHNFLSPSRICLLILDECHQAKGRSPYSEVMKYIASETTQPLIFGLSASLINNKCKPHHFDDELDELKKTLLSDITTATDYRDILKYGTDAKDYVIHYNESKTNEIFHDIVQRMNIIYEEIKRTEKQKSAKRKLDPEFEEMLTTYPQSSRSYLEILEDVSPKPEQCIFTVLKILNALGPWCAYCAAKLLCEELQNNTMQPDDDKQVTLTKVINILKDFIGISERFEMHSFVKTMPLIPHKLQRLINVFKGLNKWCLKIKQQEEMEMVKNQKHKVTFLEDPRSYIENKRNDNFSSFSLCGIIFVKERLMAYTLCKWLNELSEKDDQLSFIKAEYIIGQGYLQRDLTTGKFYMSAKNQKEIVKRFRNKEFNVLIATSVLEEGLDVQKCNFVIRFDFPDNFKSFIQSKGRARAKKSLYIIFMSYVDKIKLYVDLTNYKTIEKMLTENCFKKETDVDDEIAPEREIAPPYEKITESGRSIITASAAVGLLHRYCAKLPSDASVNLRPHFSFEIVDPDSAKKEFTCTVLLPINCPVHEPIKSQKRESKVEVKKLAALEACKKLDEAGELDDHLLPKNNDQIIDVAAEELGVLPEETDTFGDGKPGTSKRRQLYKKAVAEVFQNNIPTNDVPCYLYVFVMDLTVPLPSCLNPRNRPIVNSSDTSEGFGLLSTVILPKVCQFPIFTKCGKILVDMQLSQKQVKISKKNLDIIASFHDFVFRDTLWLIKSYMDFLQQAADFSTFIVPVNKDGRGNYYIDMDIMAASLSHDYNREKDMEFKQIPRKSFDRSIFENAVVTKAYHKFKWKTERPVFYHITRICDDMTPLSYMKDEITFKKHFKDVYLVDVKHDDQPLLDVHRVQILNMLSPIYTSKQQIIHTEQEESLSKTKQAHKRFREYLIPELCIVHPFPDPLFRKATYLPTILFRWNELLVAEQIRAAVAQEVLVGTPSLNSEFQWPTFHLETSDLQLREHLIENGLMVPEDNYVEKPEDICKDSNGYISNFEVSVSEPLGPSPSLLLQALTTKRMHDEFDLERLEIIGDSFLKYTISVKLFSMYPTFDEGKLTALRIKVIKNLNLYQLMKQKSLSNYLMNLAFYCTSPSFNEHRPGKYVPQANWLPPCYIVDDKFFNELKNTSENRNSEEIMSDDGDIKANLNESDENDVVNSDNENSDDEDMKNLNESNESVVIDSDNENSGDEMDVSPLNTSEGSSDMGEDCDEKVVNKENNENCNKISEKQAKKRSKRIPNEIFYTHHLTSDKCVADSAEALIGAYLLSCGHNGALYFMHWLGVSPFVIQKLGSDEQLTDYTWPPIPPNPLRREQSLVQSMENLLNFDKFEERIGYKFKQPAYLLQAFTHASYNSSFNDLTDCYQRLEFLGDAILDYLVTRTLYESPIKHTPGQLTDLRMALVNNAYFASLAVAYGFHKNLRCLSTTLYKLTNQYVELLENTGSFDYFKEHGYYQDYQYYLEENESMDIDEIEVPKALGDIVESVAGAIYLDSGSSLNAVWNVYYKMMKPSIDHLCQYVPKSPVRELYELSGTGFKDIETRNDKTYARVVLPDGTEFTGVGPNKKVAKSSAAKRAVVYLKKQQQTPLTSEN